MAIKIQSLEQVANTYTESGYLYKDLALDLQQTSIVAPGFNIPVPGTDIKASFDLAAIKNSLLNLFNTIPGQRFLFPEYGLDLYQFLFSPITEFNGQLLGERIFEGIKIYESRVRPRQVRVQIDPDNNQYDVTVVIEVPLLKLTADLEFLLDVKKQSFIFLPNSRNK
jgi:phage baseplate assembly protein W